MQEQPLLEDPCFFVVHHPERKIKLHFLGIYHAVQFRQLPIWCQKKIKSMDVLFHEGSGATVFIDPFSMPLPLYFFNPKLHYNWFDNLNEDEQAIVQKVMNLYCKNVKGSHFPIPPVQELRFWCINELVAHFEYFYQGQNIDYILHNHFVHNKKMVISLDKPNSAFQKEHMHYALQAELQSLKNKYDPIPILKKQLQNIKTYFETGNYDDRIDEDDPDEFIDFPEFTYPHFHFFIESANNIAMEMPSYIPKRNIEWLKIIEETITASHTTYQNESALILCGIAHLPDLFARLIFKGFHVHHLTEKTHLPLESHMLDLIHSYRLYHETFQNLKSEIIGEDYAPINWLRKMTFPISAKPQETNNHQGTHPYPLVKFDS
jgi:hypothetical protein